MLHLGCFSLYRCNTVWRSLRIYHSGDRFYHRLVGSCIVPMCVDGNCGLCNLSPNMVWYTKRLLVCSDVFHYITKQFIFLSNKGSQTYSRDSRLILEYIHSRSRLPVSRHVAFLCTQALNPYIGGNLCTWYYHMHMCVTN